MTDPWSAEAAGALIEAFHQQVPSRPERPPTLMEISGYPHYENVCSNILAFFFDPSKPHGLGTLFLDALAEVGCVKDLDLTRGASVTVETEVHTESHNRIDILIESDTHVILIENKIFHHIANPFEDYVKHLELYYKHLKPHLFLLTLKPTDDVGRFRNITYVQLVNEIRALLGNHVATADTRYLTFMLDFLNTLDHLREGREMNEKAAEFLAKDDNYTKAKHFFKEIDTFRDDLRQTVSELGSHLDDVTNDGRVGQGKWREKHGLYDIHWNDVEHSAFPENKIALNAIIRPTGWSFEIFLQKEPPDPRTQATLKNLLRKLKIEFDDEYRFTLQKRFKYNDELQEVATFVREVVEKIKQSSDSTP